MSFGRVIVTPEQRREETLARRHAPAQAVTVKPLHVGVYGGEVRPVATKPKATQKQPVHRSESWLDAVRSIEHCVRCGTHGTEPAHRNEGKGMAQKQADAATAALCRTCHRELDQGKTMTREEKRAELDRCIVLTLIALAQAGKVKAT